MNFYATKALENHLNDALLQDIFAPKSSRMNEFCNTSRPKFHSYKSNLTTTKIHNSTTNN
jgi:hypothetical protein